jgi:hypothetical protein
MRILVKTQEKKDFKNVLNMSKQLKSDQLFKCYHGIHKQIKRTISE